MTECVGKEIIMRQNEATWDEDLFLSADERDELEELAKACDSEEMVEEFNAAIHEAAMQECDTND